jgi:hypothetical protein
VSIPPRPRQVAKLPGLRQNSSARACPELRTMIAETSWTAARKLRASLSWRVAMARKCLILLKKRSMRLRSQ